MAFVYETAIDPGAENNSHAFTLDIVGHNKRVLEVGCATGKATLPLARLAATLALNRERHLSLRLSCPYLINGDNR